MSITRNLKVVSLCCTILSLFAACANSKKIAYFNNIQDTVLKNPAIAVEPVIQKEDLLSITVSSLNPEASYIFNSPNVLTATAASTTSSTNSTTGAGASSGPIGGPTQLIGYLVDERGSIKFPVLGSVQVAGLTKRQLEDSIARSLEDKKLLQDPIVNVRFLNFRVTVLGEVARPTTINVVSERISIMEALGLAGDLTIYAKRENVMLIREEDNKKIIKRLDLSSAALLSSPYYYLKTNDIVYVEPNKTKVASTSRTLQLLPIILSGLSLVAVIVSYYIKN